MFNQLEIFTGNYLVVFGGYSHRHNKEEICYDNQMYLYHLGCHAWVSHDVLSVSDKSKINLKKVDSLFFVLYSIFSPRFSLP